MRLARRVLIVAAMLVPLWTVPPAESAEGDQALRAQLDAPLLVVKRHNYLGIHIYDTFYKWRPGGGIYIIENPADPPEKHRIRALIDAGTQPTLGGGIYSEPELSWDATRVLFCYKPTSGGSTSVYEIGIDGTGLRRLTDPTPLCATYKGNHSGHHDVGPAYLPDGRIVFTSTRLNGLVPCANNGVDILHVMNADGSDVRALSVNNVNEFDPAVLHDGRLIHGRWEYIDKTALTQQSLWTIFPDGTNETAFYANNMVFPEAVLDVRPVPGSAHLVAASFTPHNAPPRGTVAIIDPYAGKNEPGAIHNFDTPKTPTHDRGNSCEPWPLSKDVMLYSGRVGKMKTNAILLADRTGRKVTVCVDPKIDLHSPMLIKPRPRPPVLNDGSADKARTGRFLVQDIYRGLDGVKRGEVKFLRVIEETSRVTGTHGKAYNQVFVLSCALAFSVKNYLGVVPVEPDGSAYFEVPAGRAVYLHALDADGRLVRSMRTFVQAVPGVTRSCIGCHEYKYGAPPRHQPMASRRAPDKLKPESWGSGYVDYTSMVQPIFDKHCVSCHGGEKGFAGRLDLSGGWTEHFNISYENLTSRRYRQLTAHLISGIDCMNGTAKWSAQILGPRSHGSGSAPLAQVLVSGHKERIKNLTRAERDLILAWIDTNGLYHGTWNYTPGGSVNHAWAGVKADVTREMRSAGCMRCHAPGGKLALFEDDWINLKTPEHSRILRAPLAKGGQGLGQALCRDVKVDPKRRRIIMLWSGYAHKVLPLTHYNERPKLAPPPPESAKPVVTFADTDDPNYRKMLTVIRAARQKALATPRTDMPGAKLQAGAPRQLLALPIPRPLPSLRADVDANGSVRLAWEQSSRTIGLSTQVHRDTAPDFQPTDKTLLSETTLFTFTDATASPGPQHYALVLVSHTPSDHVEVARSGAIRATVTVPVPAPPAAPTDLTAAGRAGQVDLTWQSPRRPADLRYHVYRTDPGATAPKRLTADAVADCAFSDTTGHPKTVYTYTVRAIGLRGSQGQPSPGAQAASLPIVKDPSFIAPLTGDTAGSIYGRDAIKGVLHGKAKIADGALDLRHGGHVTFPWQREFELAAGEGFTVAVRVRFDREEKMPVVVSCGQWRKAGWFLQRIGAGWRWHVGGVDCDGGKPAVGRWTHLVATYDGRTARLYQDGKPVGARAGAASRAPWRKPMYVGHYGSLPGQPFQVLGQIAEVRIYNRTMPPEEVAEAHKASHP